MTIGAALDALLYRQRAEGAPPGPQGTRWLDTDAGRLRVFDSGGSGHPIVFAPDGPCVIEHYATLVDELRTHARVICFDLPGFGFSFPTAAYDHGIDAGTAAIVAVLEALDLRQVTLALSCVNGFYGIAAAAKYRDRIERLVLSQTPSLSAMQAWTQRVVPKPIRVPLLGQAINFATRRRIASGWYDIVVPDAGQRAAFRQLAGAALDHGACFCFASVVQGMTSGPAKPPSLQNVDVPTTLVWGAKDRSHRKTDPASLRELLPSARIEVFEHCGHFPELEDPARYAGLVRSLHPQRG